MAQGEFALVKLLLEKGVHRGQSTLIDVHDLYAMLADAAVGLRDQNDIRKYAHLLEEAAEPLEHQLYLATARRAWGVLGRLEGDYAVAEARLEQAAQIFRGLDTRWQLGRTYMELAHLATDRSDSVRAKQHFGRALELFDELGAVPDAERAKKALAITNNEL